jgi:hypothetical protein
MAAISSVIGRGVSFAISIYLRSLVPLSKLLK